ncbi:MAG: hypothetical protein ACOYBQ_09905 [Fluviibacter sp.]
MIAYPTPMLRIIRRRSQIAVIKQAARHGFVAAKGLAMGVGMYLMLVFILGG